MLITMSGSNDATEMAAQIVGMVYKFKFSRSVQDFCISKVTPMLSRHIRRVRPWGRNMDTTNASGDCFRAVMAESTIRVTTQFTNSITIFELRLPSLRRAFPSSVECKKVFSFGSKFDGGGKVSWPVRQN